MIQAFGLLRRVATPDISRTNRRERVMANTFTGVHCHIVFSIKRREPWIRFEVQEYLWAYLVASNEPAKMMNHMEVVATRRILIH